MKKFETWDKSLSKTGIDSENVVINEALREIIEKSPDNTVKDYAEELGVSPTTISRRLK